MPIENGHEAEKNCNFSIFSSRLKDIEKRDNAMRENKSGYQNLKGIRGATAMKH